MVFRKKNAGYPDENRYRDAFRLALARMAVTINNDLAKDEKNYPVPRGLFTKQDDTLLKKLDDSNLAASLFRLNIIQHDEALKDEDEFKAENFFYADLTIRRESRAVGEGMPAFNRRSVEYRVPETFVEWSCKRFHAPEGSNESLERSLFRTEDAFLFSCAANYLLKNFWHNFVHREIQGISSDNYRDFAGAARYDSDFEADNLGTLFLIASYGYPILTRGKPSRQSDSIRALLARNRCNLVFQERASHRTTDRSLHSAIELFQEAEWRFFRQICNRMSGELAAEGLAVRSIRVFANGRIRQSSQRIWRDGRVIVELNGRRYATDSPVYVPPVEYKDANPPEEKSKHARRFRRKRVEEIAVAVIARYRREILQDAALRHDASESLNLLFIRCGMKSLAER